jgi:hypothetical protein
VPYGDDGPARSNRFDRIASAFDFSSSSLVSQQTQRRLVTTKVGNLSELATGAYYLKTPCVAIRVLASNWKIRQQVSGE